MASQTMLQLQSKESLENTILERINLRQTKRIVLKQSKKAYMLADSDKFYQMGNYEYAKVDAFYGILQTIKNNKK